MIGSEAPKRSSCQAEIIAVYLSAHLIDVRRRSTSLVLFHTSHFVSHCDNGRQTGLVDDGSPLRPVLHMLTPSRDLGQILVDHVDPAL